MVTIILMKFVVIDYEGSGCGKILNDDEIISLRLLITIIAIITDIQINSGKNNNS